MKHLLTSPSFVPVRSALLLSLLSLALTALPACGPDEVVEDPSEMKMLVLGMDGMDPILLERMWEDGRMPNFRRLANLGQYSPLATSMPPQSPVAWSNFISGADAGTHEIYDFIHRKPNPEKNIPIEPYLSTSEALPPGEPSWFMPERIAMGDWQIPLTSGSIANLRQGDAFWDSLLEGGVDTTIYRMPANYPPPVEIKGAGRFQCICGMGTPDLMGSYGDFFCFQEELLSKEKRVAGGTFIQLTVVDDHTVATIPGPENFLRNMPKGKKPPAMTCDLQITRDPTDPTVLIEAGDRKVVLGEGEWSDWIPVVFETGIPGSTILSAMTLPTSMSAIVRVHLKSVRPLDFYVSPLNIDPANAVNPVSYPVSFAADVANTTGMGGMYTTGIPEDTKALRSRPQALNEDQFLEMVQLLAKGRTRQYKDALANFKSGFLFFYFGHTDQLAHIFWRDMDPGHPGRLPEQEGKYEHVIEDVYEEMDVRLGEAFEVMDENDILIVMSDHGFCSFRRGFNVNNWLLENGYLKLDPKADRRLRRTLYEIDYKNTRAYALGINCVYVNLEGREKYGIVPPAERDALVREIAQKLEQVVDVDGSRVIDKVYIVDDYYPDRDPEIAPEMLVGYTRNYRGSWATAEGGRGRGLLEDNRDRWSGDHCISAPLVPGIVLSNMKLNTDDPTLSDLGPSILHCFNLKPSEKMKGRNVFAEQLPLTVGRRGATAQ